MSDPFVKLYDSITSRKSKQEDFEPYAGGNGRIDRAVDLILNEDFPRTGTLLDVGGATGNLGYALREHFTDRITLDIAEECRAPATAKGNRFGRTNIDVNGFVDEDPNTMFFVQDDSVDLIVALDFIEHILDPGGFVRHCMRALKSGGRVLINTPNIQFWRHLHSLVVDGVFPHTSGDSEVYHGGHVAFFNMHDMERLFGHRGFIDMKMHTRGLQPDPPPPIWAQISSVPAIQLAYPDLIFSCRKP
jgi:2-polyprenyl-3-methyl-5-hydroxy-6-metoxy-1,4-benzoquinol methylase